MTPGNMNNSIKQKSWNDLASGDAFVIINYIEFDILIRQVINSIEMTFFVSDPC
jgi:hypothetical protein